MPGDLSIRLRINTAVIAELEPHLLFAVRTELLTVDECMKLLTDELIKSIEVINANC